MVDKIKKCSKCGRELSVEFFSKDKHTKDGKRYRCKDCDKQYRIDHKERVKQYRIDHKEHRIKYDKQYKFDNKEHLIEYNKQYRINNKEYIVECKKQYYIDNKECFAERGKQYYIDNKELFAKRGKQYYINNKERFVEYSKQYYIDNKEHIAECVKQYRIDNKEYYVEYGKQYRINNKERIKQWYRDNPKKVRKYRQNNQSIRRGWGIPIALNEYFEDSHFHHLHTINSETREIDRQIGIFIPVKLHKSVNHSHKRRKSMLKINKLAFEFLYTQINN